MVEILTENRSKSFGWFKNFKAAKGMLNSLIASDESGATPILLVDSYKGGELQQQCTVTYSSYFGTWNVSALPKVCALKRDRKKRQHRKQQCKVYKSAVDCFREGFPDWMNRTYQPV